MSPDRGRGADAGLHPADTSSGRRVGRVLVLVAALVACGYSAACAAPTDDAVPGRAPSSVPSPSGPAPRPKSDVTHIRAEVRFSASDDEGVQQVTVPLDSQVELVVTGDPPGPLHLRGYERYAEPDGGSNVLRFVADLPGRFIVERDETGTAVVEVEVIDPDEVIDSDGP